ncbi:ATPase E1-E2 type family protein [Actinidia rufa]|uniref:P-type phospholipid transporter n=1 Tax=Actinidia rufa TaxID=165716 RepID=A0A7J0G019_9ERIC|nr:ATPase E1-E2 type family protein [Actinidia rufa]
MARGRIRARIRRSHLYTFACIRTQDTELEEPHQFEGPGYSRIVYCNEPRRHEKKPLNYCTNYISTTKYNIITFLPKAIFEQFRRVANLYFLLAAILSLTDVAPFSALSMIAPLAFVVGLSMAKEALEDWRRFIQDMKVNMRKAKVQKGNGVFGHKPWMKLRVGDVVKVEKDQFFPADLLLLSSSYEDGICYVETMNLDGETNLKVKRALEVTLPLEDDMAFKDFTGKIKCEDPNPNLYTFVGNLEYDRQIYPLDLSQILLRDSKLRNTTYVYGVVIFTGPDSKVMQNATKSPSKGGAGLRNRWIKSFTFFSASLCLFHLVTALILYGYLIPISLYVSIEVVKVLQAMFINQDIHMYDEETGTPAQARTSNLNEELGQVDTILSDKTGTLTCNQMDFLKCSIAGMAYGTRSSEVELAAARQMASELDARDSISSNKNGTDASEIELETVVTCKDEKDQKSPIKGFSFEDSRLMHGNWETGAFTYEAESPDEGAFLVAAREFGFEFCRRTQSSIFVRERHPSSEQPIEREYKILNLLDFTSKRKRMSVIIRGEDGQIFLLCKGADSIIFDRLAKNGRMFEEPTTKHLNDYGEAAKTSIGGDREAMLERVSDMMERDLTLVGATAVEDKLQKGVPQCIDKLAQAGLKIWVLTGDKLETAINIGFACSLLRQGMKQICITTNTGYVSTRSNEAVKEKRCVMQITNASQMIKLEKDPHAAWLFICNMLSCLSRQKALVTRLVKEGTGKTTLAIGDGANDVGMIQEADIGVGISGVEGMQAYKILSFLQAVMASDFAIAQFRFLERLLVVHGHWCYKRIAQMICYFFYKNIAFGLTLFYFEAFTGFSGQSVYDDWYMLLFNVILTSLPVISLGVFEQDVSSEICLQGFDSELYKIVRTLTISGGLRRYSIIPSPLSARTKKICSLTGLGYLDGWEMAFILPSLFFFLNVIIFYDQSFRSGGQTADMSAVGTTMFTCIIWAVNCQIALTMSHFTWIQHLLVWGSVATWYLFLLLYGMLSPVYSGNAFRLLVEALAPAPIYWITTLLVTITCNLPYLAHLSFQRCFHPMDHHIIQEIKYYKKDVEDRHMWTRERSKARQETKIGFTARVDATIRQLRGRLTKKYSTLPPQVAMSPS